MPKEIIDSKYFGQRVRDDNLDREVPIESTYVHLGWEKDLAHVELAVLNPAAPEDSNGWFVQLDRGGINRLIKVLRTARDQSFGRDE